MEKQDKLPVKEIDKKWVEQSLLLLVALFEPVYFKLGHKEIWIELEQLNNTVSLIATMAHELAHYKPIGEYRMEEKDELLIDLTAVALGLGILKGTRTLNFPGGKQFHIPAGVCKGAVIFQNE